MICVEVKKDGNDEIVGFHCIGHSGYAQSGKDIVCSAVSALVINCVNSIEEFTDAKFQLKTEEQSGDIDFLLESPLDDSIRLLLASMFLGLTGIQEAYGKEYLSIH